MIVAVVAVLVVMVTMVMDVAVWCVLYGARSRLCGTRRVVCLMWKRTLSCHVTCTFMRACVDVVHECKCTCTCPSKRSCKNKNTRLRINQELVQRGMGVTWFRH